MKYLILLLILVLPLSGCTSSGISKSEYNQNMKSVRIGMTKAAFIALFRSATPRGAKAYPNGTVEVFEQFVSTYHFFPTGNRNRNDFTGIESELQWFYFYNDSLVQYGKPNDWPQNPHLIIETISR